MNKLLTFVLSFFVPLFCFTQEIDKRQLDVDLEFRPRFEFRYGYKELPANNSHPSFFTSSRTRLSLDFKQKSTKFHASLQDVRIWGQNGASPAIGSLHVFETYACFALPKNWEIKLGRQSIELDNGRLFSEGNWNQYSRAHDGIQLSFNKKKIDTRFFLFYNQNAANLFGTSYLNNTYKYLFTHFFSFKHSENFSFNIINTFDGYEKPNNEAVVYARGTSGGRLNFKKKKLAFTLAAYYQYGQLNTGQHISSYYVQPELSYKFKKNKIRLGAEYLSGDDRFSSRSHSFSTLYGVAFKFNGHLNYFTSFPVDVRNGGLINPYLFLDFRLRRKLRLKIETHLFYIAQPDTPLSYSSISPFLGSEFDVKLKHRLGKTVTIDAGISTLIATESMGKIKNGNHKNVPIFSFIMLTWKPKLLSIKQPI